MEKISVRLKEVKEELNKIWNQRESFDYLYYVGKDNEDKICRDIENYIKNYYKIFK